MIPNIISRLFAQTYNFIFEKALLDWAWEDVITAVSARQTAYQETRAAFAHVLPILASLAAGGQAEPAIPLAAAWVLYDLASDIFDDLQDQDGKDWPWNHWQPARGMNVGLGLIAAAEICLANVPASGNVRADILESWAHTFARAVRGQVEQGRNESIEQYFCQTAAKSGLIYANVTRAGAHLATDDSKVLQGIYDYGLALGMIIQLKDDYRDIRSIDQMSDLSTGAYTLPVIYALSQKEHPCYPELLAHLHGKVKFTPAEVMAIHRLLTEMSALSYTFMMARGYEQKALAALSSLPVTNVTHLSIYVSSFFPS
ncbi:MAG: polyprenyl synthetase family protein [Anaerolineae bacterium]